MKQKTALEILKTGRNAFLTGAAGTGKTYVLNKYISWLRENNIPVAVTASTGIAATHISGQTIHSWSGIGIKDVLTDWDLDNLSQKEALVRRLNNVSVLIIDEISMLRADILDNINLILQTLRNNNEPFGGVQLVLSGDFFQLPPIVPFSGNIDFSYGSIFAFSSDSWQSLGLKILYLTEQFRQKDELIDILNAIRRKELTGDLLDKLKARLDKTNEDEETSPVKLHTHNANVDKINEKELNSMVGKIYEYPMSLSGNKAKAENLARNLLAPEILKLKEGARVMFVKNDPQGAYVNGSLGTVVGFEYGLPKILLDSGSEILAEKAEWTIENENGKKLAGAEQLPLRLAWAITVHKSQGLTMDKAEMDLSKSFVEGQGYVALSRVKGLEGLYIHGLNDTALQVSDLVFDYDQVFQSESKQVEKVFGNYSDEKKDNMQLEFVKNFQKNPTQKISTHEQSVSLLKSGKNIKAIAQERDLKISTIINHLERAQEEGIDFDISHEVLKFNKNKVFEEFKHKGFEKLSPIHSALKGVYDFDTLRLLRIAYKQTLRD